MSSRDAVLGDEPTAVAASTHERVLASSGPALLVALLAVLAILAAPGVSVDAQVLQQVVVAEPGAGATVSGTGVVVDVRGLGQVDWVQARVVSGAGKAGGVANLRGPESQATGSRWRGTLDVAGLANGAARVEARAQLSSGVTEWSGHAVRLDFPAPATTLHAGPVAGRRDAVALSWQPAPSPDVNRYELQRALAGGGWEHLVAVGGGQHAHTDVGVPDGTHRYRVRASRPGADGNARPGPWAESAVALAGPGAGAAGGPPGSGEPTSGVAPAPPTGGMPAQLRSGSEGVGAGREGTSMAPLVAPREDFGVLEPFEGPGPVVAGPESAGDLARGVGSSLQLSQEGDPLGSDAVRLVGLFLAGVLAWRAQHTTAPGRGGPRGMARLRAAPLLAPVGAGGGPDEEPLWSRPANSWAPLGPAASGAGDDEG